MNDFDGEHARSFGITKFGEEQTSGFVNSGKSCFDIQGFESGHGEFVRRFCLTEWAKTNSLGWEGAERKRKNRATRREDAILVLITKQL
jgi:hypothetical protein